MVTITGEAVPSRHMQTLLARERGGIQRPTLQMGVPVPPMVPETRHLQSPVAKRHHGAGIYLAVAGAFLVVSLALCFLV